MTKASVAAAILIPNPKARLFDQVREAMRFHHYALRTEQAYLQWMRRSLVFHRNGAGRPEAANDWRPPKDMGAAEVREFLTDLAANRDVAASTQNQALTALVFLYGQVLRHALARKYPQAEREWAWQWVFAAQQRSKRSAERISCDPHSPFSRLRCAYRASISRRRTAGRPGPRRVEGASGSGTPAASAWRGAADGDCPRSVPRASSNNSWMHRCAYRVQDLVWNRRSKLLNLQTSAYE